MGYYNMEKEPKGAKSSDTTGEKKLGPTSFNKMTGVNSMKGTKGMSGEKLPKNADSADTSGERKMPLVGGVALGKADGIGMREASHMGKQDGMVGECKGHMGESCVYDHKRVEHVQDSM